MQWLHTFIYEMKGTHTPPNDWCMVFELSLQDGALHWYRQLPRKTRRTWKLLSDAFIKYYCSKFNQSAKARRVSKRRTTKNTSRTRTRSVPESAETTKTDTLTDYDYAGEDERGHVAAANDHERRAAAEGTFARSDNGRPKGDSHFNNDRGFTRDNRNGRQQYGPCAACGGLTHSVHYCYKRCKKVHDAGKCEAFNELASLLRSKVDKNDLTPMLQSVVPPTETGLVPIGLPQLAEPAVDADYLFAFAREVNRPEDREMGFVDTTEIVEGNDGSLGENEIVEVDGREYDGYLTEVSASCWGPNETSSRSLGQTAKLLPGERLG
ncbi:LOW QUALITY PROTEIN: hypothetical protein PHMEG_00031553, partial [Phytophthora megakarya]